MEEEGRQEKAVTMKKQGAWVNLESVRKRRLSWNEIMSMQDQKLSFLLKFLYEVLPSPTNLCVWGMIEEPCVYSLQRKSQSGTHTVSMQDGSSSRKIHLAS